MPENGWELAKGSGREAKEEVNLKTFLLPSVVLPSVVLLLCTAAFGAPCGSGLLDAYIGLGATGCDLGAVRFDNFAIETPGQFGASPILASEVEVSTGGTFYMPFLRFTLNATANGNDFLESFFRFRASGPSLQAAAITLTGATATGNGAAIGILDLCPGGMFSEGPTGCDNPPAVGTVVSSDFPSDSVNTPLSSFFDVFVSLSVDGGGDGTATLPSATVGITATPEPASWLLFAGGFGVVGLWRSRRVF